MDKTLSRSNVTCEIALQQGVKGDERDGKPVKGTERIRERKISVGNALNGSN